eukprot:scaffold131556_cov34-Tisochrysis_lutea.AAC.1
MAAIVVHANSRYELLTVTGEKMDRLDRYGHHAQAREGVLPKHEKWAPGPDAHPDPDPMLSRDLDELCLPSMRGNCSMEMRHIDAV